MEKDFMSTKSGGKYTFLGKADILAMRYLYSSERVQLRAMKIKIQKGICIFAGTAEILAMRYTYREVRGYIEKYNSILLGEGEIMAMRKVQLRVLKIQIKKKIYFCGESRYLRNEVPL